MPKFYKNLLTAVFLNTFAYYSCKNFIYKIYQNQYASLSKRIDTKVEFKKI